MNRLRVPLALRPRRLLGVRLLGAFALAPVLALLGGCKEKPGAPATPAAPAGPAAAPAATGVAAGAPQAPVGQTPATVSGDERSRHFDAVREHLDVGGTVFAYVDIDGDVEKLVGVADRLITQLSGLAGEPIPIDAAFLGEIAESYGLTGLKAMGASSIKIDGLFRNRTFQYLPGGLVGSFAMGGVEPVAFRALEIAPANAVLVADFRVERFRITSGVEEWAGRLEGSVGLPGGGEDPYDAPLSPVTPDLSINDVLERLDTRVSAALAFGEGTVKLADAFEVPALNYVVSATDLGWLFDAFLPAMKDADAVTVTETPERITVEFSAPRLDPDLPELFSGVLIRERSDGRVHFASSVAFLDACLAGSTSIRDDPTFRRMMKGLPTQGNEFVYLSPVLTERALALLEQIPQLPPPARDLIVEAVHLFTNGGEDGFVTVAVPHADGLESVGNGPVSLKLASTAPAVVVVGLVAAMAIPAFNKVRTTSQEKTILNHLRMIASASDQYFIETGSIEARAEDIFGPDLYIKAVPTAVAGEDYLSVFPVKIGFIELSVTTEDGRTITYSQ